MVRAEAQEEFLQQASDTIWENAAQVVTKGKDADIFNNAPWYRKWYSDHGRPPTEQELDTIARDIAMDEPDRKTQTAFRETAAFNSPDLPKDIMDFLYEKGA